MHYCGYLELLQPNWSSQTIMSITQASDAIKSIKDKEDIIKNIQMVKNSQNGKTWKLGNIFLLVIIEKEKKSL